MEKAESIINEFEEIHNESENFTMLDVWDTLENLAIAIMDNGYSLGEDILKKIKARRFDDNKCPDCSEELSSKPQVVNVSEAWGKPVCETCDKLSCSSCGWTQYEE